MQPHREIIAIPSNGKPHILIDPNDVHGDRAIVMVSGRGGRITGWFGEENLEALRDAVTQTLDRSAAEKRLERYDPTTCVGPVVEPMALAGKGNGKSTEVNRLTVDEGERRRAIEWWDLLSPDQQEAAVVAMARLYASIQAVRG